MSQTSFGLSKISAERQTNSRTTLTKTWKQQMLSVSDVGEPRGKGQQATNTASSHSAMKAAQPPGHWEHHWMPLCTCQGPRPEMGSCRRPMRMCWKRRSLPIVRPTAGRLTQPHPPSAHTVDWTIPVSGMYSIGTLGQLWTKWEKKYFIHCIYW